VGTGGPDRTVAIRRVAAGQSLLHPAVTARVLDRIRRGPDQPDEPNIRRPDPLWTQRLCGIEFSA